MTPSITYVESSEQFWCKIHQIWRICKPWSLWSTFLRAMTYHVHKNISDHHHRCLVIIPSRIQCIQEIVIKWSHDIFANLTRVKQKGENMTKEKNTKIQHTVTNWIPFVCHKTKQQHLQEKGSIQRKIHFMPLSQSQLEGRYHTAEGRYHTFSIRWSVTTCLSPEYNLSPCLCKTIV